MEHEKDICECGHFKKQHHENYIMANKVGCFADVSEKGERYKEENDNRK